MTITCTIKKRYVNLSYYCYYGYHLHSAAFVKNKVKNGKILVKKYD